MSFLNTTASIQHSTAIPLPTSHKAAAVALLHDHDFYLRCDPHLTKYEPVPTPDPAPSWESYKIPASVATATSSDQRVVRLYDVTDHVPNPVYSSNIVSREVLVDWSEGLWVRLHSAMGVVMETTWFVREKDGGLELVEEVKISCNRMLMSLVRGSVETNWQGIHTKIVERMVADAKMEAGSS